MSNRKQKTKENLGLGRLITAIIVGIILVLFTVIDSFFYDILGEEYRGDVYLLVSLVLVILIFVFQALDQKVVFNKLNDKLIAMLPFNTLKKEVLAEVERWLAEEESNLVVFYFPYSIAPGFWLDAGKTASGFFKNIKSKPSSSFEHTLYFIGSGIEDSPFSQSVEKLKEKLTDQTNAEVFIKNHIHGTFYGNFNFDRYESDKVDKLIKKIKEEYAKLLGEIDEISSDKTFFKRLRISLKDDHEIQSIDNLPNFSFALKINKNKAEDLILIDTFGKLQENSSLEKVVERLGVNQIAPEDLFTNPNAIIVKNKQVANLFFTTFFETCCQHDAFNGLREDLKKI